jgi:hypothetical protein
VAELVMLVRDLQAQLVTTAETAAMWQERAGTLSDRLALAESRLAALRAPEDAPDSPPTSNLTAEHPDPITEPRPDPFPEPLPPTPNGSPWWRRHLAAWREAIGGW